MMQAEEAVSRIKVRFKRFMQTIQRDKNMLEIVSLPKWDEENTHNVRL